MRGEGRKPTHSFFPIFDTLVIIISRQFSYGDWSSRSTVL